MELYATLFGVMAFAPRGGSDEGVAVITGAASTDSKGNAYAAARLMSTRFPLNAMIMEFPEQFGGRALLDESGRGTEASE